jgi:hypothetical protein
MLPLSERSNFAWTKKRICTEKCQRKKDLGYEKMKQRNGSYNKTKKRALEVLENKTWMDVSAFAHKVGIRPVRRAYTYLAHLEDLGLVIRGWDAHDKLHFQITARGLHRLEWLRSQNSVTTLEALIAPLLR